MNFSVEYTIHIIWIAAFIVGTIFYHKKVKAHFRYFQVVNNAFVGYKNADEYFRSSNSKGLKENYKETIIVSAPIFFRDRLGEKITGNPEVKVLVRKVVMYNWITIVCVTIFLTEIYLQLKK